MTAFTKYEARRIREIARQFVVAKFYGEDLDLFWKRVWKEWVDFKPFPCPEDMDMDEYEYCCEQRLKVGVYILCLSCTGSSSFIGPEGSGPLGRVVISWRRS
jgi:hypothetical protein